MNAIMRPHYSVEPPPRWPIVLAVLLHLLLISWVIYAGKYLAPPEPEPLPYIVELWEGGQAPKPMPISVPRQPSQTWEKLPDLDMPGITDAEVNLNAMKERAERERQQRPTLHVEPERPQPSPQPQQAQPERQPAKPQTKPTKPQPQVDPTADMDLPGTGTGGKGRQGTGNAARNQQGGQTGAENGERGGKGVNLDAYKREAAIRVRANASAPPGTEGSPRVTVVVRLDPSMRVIGVSVAKSSGDSAYDQAVVQGVRNVGQFPPCPDGASMDLFRNITLNISLPNR